MNKPRINEVIIVEGKYDAATLANIVDALIITTDGFSVFSKSETKDMIKKLGKERGLIILTDSDGAGFKIRNYINNFAKGVDIKNAYIPSIQGKESRKEQASKEGLLGVEGVNKQTILTALKTAGVFESEISTAKQITFTDLYTLGLSGTPQSFERRHTLLKRLGLPVRLSKNALCQVLSSLYTYEQLSDLCNTKNA